MYQICWCMKDCINCKNVAIKYGRTPGKKQRYFCKVCRKTFVEEYTYQAYCPTTNNNIIKLLKEGNGVRGIARLVNISTTTTLKRILLISKTIVKPAISIGKQYEVDEMRIFIRRKSKLFWIVYALEKKTKLVLDFAVGGRTNNTLSKGINTLLLSKAKRIYTDNLKNYKYIIPKKVHRTVQFGTNHIERFHLNLRIHLKRLNRRTICYSKSLQMLTACLKIYFWE